MITVVGFPRSGTNFLHRMLVHYVDGPGMAPWTGMTTHPQVRKIHCAYQRGEGEREVYIYRDPRDCALSGYEYVEGGFAPDIALMTFLDTYFRGRSELWRCGWRENVRYWLGQGIPALSYEALCREREARLSEVVVALELELEDERLAWAAEQSYRFGQHRVGDRYMGHTGRWKTEMPDEALRWIDDYCGDLMQSLGYERELGDG